MKNAQEIRLSREQHRPLCLIVLAMGAAVGTASCGAGSDSIVDTNNQKIIGGFAANDPVLDSIGSLVVHFSNGRPGGPPASGQELCGATLVGPETVLTAKHCALIVPFIASIGGRLTFAVGPASLTPKREVDIVALELAPGDQGGFVGVGHDVAVMHLEKPITDLTPVEIDVLSDEQIGQAFAAIGYGIQDNTGANGTRRLGKQTLRSREGKIFETMFGNFENFFEWFKNGTAPMASASVVGPPDQDAGSPQGGEGGRPPGPPPISPEDIAQQIYDNTILDEGYEVVTGGAPGDAQPCFGDSGSSLIRRQNGQFVSFGVVSGGLGSTESICDLGAVYATFGPGVLEFVQAARTWTDPCGDLDSHGSCDGDVAQRCTNLLEGRRRVVSFDCSTLGMACNTAGGQVSCDGNVFAPPPPPPTPSGGKADPRGEVDKVFMSPSALAARRNKP